MCVRRRCQSGKPGAGKGRGRGCGREARSPMASHDLGGLAPPPITSLRLPLACPRNPTSLSQKVAYDLTARHRARHRVPDHQIRAPLCGTLGPHLALATYHRPDVSCISVLLQGIAYRNSDIGGTCIRSARATSSTCSRRAIIP